MDESLVDVVATPYGKPTHEYECAVHVPPRYARREFAELFHGISPVRGSLGGCSSQRCRRQVLTLVCLVLSCVVQTSVQRMSLVTLALRTRKNMATWSTDVMEERELVLKEFHELAARAVDNLRAAGHWADYIDPSSGTAVRAWHLSFLSYRFCVPR